MVDEDVRLWSAWREGDKKAGDELVRRHFAPVFRFLYGKIGDNAEELTQRVFLACLEKSSTVRIELGIRPFLFGLARIELLRHLEGRSRHGITTQQLSQTSLYSLDPSPSNVCADGEDQDLVEEALRRLTLEQQLVLELFYWEGFTVPEVATTLAIPAGTVKSRLARARERLADILHELAPGRSFSVDDGVLVPLGAPA